MKDERVKELLKKFTSRIKRTPFTLEGIPSQEERQLTNDIWSALGEGEKGEILDNTAKMVAEDRNISVDKVPDQTPYAMRLTHRYLQMESRRFK